MYAHVCSYMLDYIQSEVIKGKKTLKFMMFKLPIPCYLVQVAQAEQEKGSKKTDKKKELDQLNELFKPVVAAQKVSKGDHRPCFYCVVV